MTRMRASEGMKRVSSELDDQLPQACREATGIRGDDALVDHALRQLLGRSGQKRILALKRAVRWEGALDEMRQSRFS
jgi:Arc/MetJ family transcription regulator